jgi:inner membrane transporter RhtA
MPGRLFSILASTEPAIGALFGLAALGQHIDVLQWAGIVAVAVASAGASLDKRPSPARPDPTGQAGSVGSERQ